MNQENLNKFRHIFEIQRKKMLFDGQLVRDEFLVCEDDRFDEFDQACTDVEQSIRLRLRSRELVYMKKIEAALKRIEEGTFGNCEECGQEIEIKRLEARPTATLCVICKEEQESKLNLITNSKIIRRRRTPTLRRIA